MKGRSLKIKKIHGRKLWKWRIKNVELDLYFWKIKFIKKYGFWIMFFFLLLEIIFFLLLGIPWIEKSMVLFYALIGALSLSFIFEAEEISEETNAIQLVGGLTFLMSFVNFFIALLFIFGEGPWK